MTDKTNFPLKQKEWVKDDPCIYSGGYVFTLLDKMKFGLKVKFDLEGQGQSPPPPPLNQ